VLRKAGPVVTAVLAVGLILTVRRLSDAQTKLAYRQRNTPRSRAYAWARASGALRCVMDKREESPRACVRSAGRFPGQRPA
jgi:hypothetical protein